MKKIEILLVFFVLGFMSCKNESIDAPATEQVVSADKKLAFNPKVDPNDDVNTKLRAFNDKLDAFQKEVAVRDAQTMSVADVEWNVEAYLNATYARADKPFIDQSVNRDSFVVALTNGEVSGTNVLAALASAKSLLINQYRSIRETSKHLVFVDIATKTIGSNQLQLMVSSFVGLNPLQSRDNPYGSTDRWKYGFGLGKCDGTQLGKDAATRLNEELNARHILGNPPPGATNVYFTDIVILRIFATDPDWQNPNDVTSNDNIRDFLLYVSDQRIMMNFSTCIEFQDMNWYYNNLYTIVSNPAPLGIKPVGKEFVFSALKGDYIYHRNLPTATYLHSGEISFGIPHLVIGPPPVM
jgi:hypothetical protein